MSSNFCGFVICVAYTHVDLVCVIRKGLFMDEYTMRCGFGLRSHQRRICVTDGHLRLSFQFCAFHSRAKFKISVPG